MERLSIITTGNTVPYQNIALEKFLLDRVQPGQCFLYLWQNAHTVVIGRNQSALGEVRVAQLEVSGGHLARRLSGGGAVYHDLGNLNFTFVCRREDYDVARQTEVILRAVRALGVPARRTGRNDLVAGPAAGAEGADGAGCASGGKFSGHAYYRTGGACYHHGTLMVDVDLNALGRYLRPAPDKLAAKGVQSVRSRVVNLAQLVPGLTVGSLAEALCDAFEAEYGREAERLRFEAAEPVNLTGVGHRPQVYPVGAGHCPPFAQSAKTQPGESVRPNGRCASGASPLSAFRQAGAASAFSDADLAEIAVLTRQFSSSEWLFRDERAFERRLHARFAWGGVTLRYALADETIAECALDSDGLEADFLEVVPSLLVGCTFGRATVEAALLAAAEDESQQEVVRDVAGMFPAAS